jgi:hypothetical protein
MVERRLTRIILLGLVAAILAPGPLARSGDPRLRWRSLDTPHFTVTYATRDRKAAHRVAVLAEAAHEILAPFLRRAPRRRTHVLVTDWTDSANGMAMTLPRNVIHVYLAAPDAYSTLNDHDDWLFGLILHEYTHILHLDTIGGIARVINWIFGKTLAPNHLQPSWWIEGLAVFSESHFTSGGRNRSALYDMYLRMAVLEGKAQRIDEISSAPLRFPHGSTPYLYGSRFLEYLAARFGAEALPGISHTYSRQWIPYGFNKIAARHLKGQGYVTLYQDFLRHLGRRYGLQAEAVRRRGLREGQRVTFSGDYTFYPRFDPVDGALLLEDDDGRSDHAVKRRDPATGRWRKLFRLETGGGLALTPDGQRVVFSQMEMHRATYEYADLWAFDRRTRRTTRLTRRLRAREPDVSPDGRTIACAVSERTATHLALVPAEGLRQGLRPRILVRSTGYDQVSSPAWSPDGRTLAYVQWRQGGDRDLYTVEVATGRTRRLTADRAQELGPVWSPDGRTIYFSSDRTGIFNVYALDVATSALTQVTNVVGGALQPAISPDGKQLAYIGFTAKGFDAYVLPLDPRQALPALPYVSPRPEAKLVPEQPAPGRERRYNPLRTLGPEAWWLSGSFAPGSESVTLLLSGNDVAELHLWNLSATWDIAWQGGGAGFDYAFTGLWPYLGAGFAYYRGPRGGLTVDGRPESFVEQSWVLQAGITLPVLRSYRHGSASIGLTYRVQSFRPVDRPDLPLDPSARITHWPESGLLSGFRLDLSYSRVIGYRYSVSPEKGRALGMSVSVNHEQLGSSFRTLAAGWRWTEYLPLPWLKHHVLALKLSGGITRGNLSRRGLHTVGGIPSQDLVQALLNAAPVGGAFLRGYPSGVIWGDQYHLLNVEYRFPITWINWGPWTLPIYFRRLHGAVYTDVGNSSFGPFRARDLKVGVGAELLVDLVIGYYLWMTFRIGYAYGLMEPGGHQPYFVMGVPFG